MHRPAIHRLLAGLPPAISKAPAKAAYANDLKVHTQLGRNFPVAPPEPINNEADANLAADPLPPPEVVAEIIVPAERAKNEPSYVLPHWVAEVLLNEELMAEIAPNCNVESLLKILTSGPIPLAA